MKAAFLAFLVSRAFLVGLLLWGPTFDRLYRPEGAGVPFEGTEKGAPLPWKGSPEEGFHLYHPSRLLDAWFRHDSAFYLQIAVFSYGRAVPGQKTREGFFPAWPLAVRTLAPAFRPLASAIDRTPGLEFLLAAIFFSNACALVSVIFLVKLAIVHLGPAAGGRAGVLLALWPTGFLLSCGLTESLFLLAALLVFHEITKGRSATAAVAGLVAAATRLPGVILALPLAAHLLALRGRERWIRLPLLLLPLLGLLLALWAIGAASGDLLTYFHVQRSFGHGGAPSLRGIADLFRLAGHDAYEAPRNALQIAFLLLGCLLLGLQARLTFSRGVGPGAGRGRLPWTWLLFSLPLFLLPILAGSIISLPRYVTVIFPFVVSAAAFLPGGWKGLLLCLAALPVQGFLFLAFEAHVPLVI